MKTNTIISTILLLCMLLLGTSCSNDDSPEKEPVSVSMKVESVGERSVKLRGEISVVIKGADMLKLNAMVLNAMRIDGLAEN